MRLQLAALALLVLFQHATARELPDRHDEAALKYPAPWQTPYKNTKPLIGILAQVLFV
jgi:hypothetical protein